ncbi:hypothetical protein [Streptomyces sp. NPDC059862]|uniref:hypothetical protein n=1 Tax=unclassified Streptomyces TaxID=2593676 RepID=UPI003642AF62
MATQIEAAPAIRTVLQEAPVDADLAGPQPTQRDDDTDAEGVCEARLVVRQYT